uniref:Serine/threonine-protein kinase TBK1 n=1 Tax=Littorina littorea TaxID=31216 RepID=A0A7G8Z9Y7_LITLI|nr:serine/threonine-protein kinase TBK1 [Littorina littorea]
MSTLRGSKNYVWDTAKPLGQGATSLVYIGREKRTGEEVAVKVFTPQSYQRPRQVQTREFEVMRRLNHENVVRLLAIEEEQTMNGGEVIVMELCPNGSLYNVLDSPENSYGLCEEEFVLVLEQVSAGVKHCRDHDIIHRDIKPGNILRCVAEDGRSIYKLTDFGAARELQENEEFMSLYGTEEYLHPDMYEKAVLRHVRGQQFGVHVDLWSLGVTFYHAATGNLPFRPYGGRRNKETMHLITTTKEAGVISGVQLTENGRIEYRSELPNTCRLSLGIKRQVTPFLAALLEKDQSRTWPFDQFFEQVANITTKIIIDAFCPSLLLTMKIYADNTDTLQRLRELVAEQTDIPSNDQLLLVGGQKLSSLVQAQQPIRDYHLDISSTNPIIVFSMSGAFPQKVYTPSVGQFPQLTQAMALDHDYPQCKRCCGVLHSIIEAVRITTDTTMLVNMAVHMYCSHLKQQLSVLRESLSRLDHQMGVVNHWKQGAMTQLEHHLGLLQLTHMASGPSSDKVTKWVKVIQAAHQTHKNDCETLFNKLQGNSGQANAQLQEAVSMQASVGDWDTALGCTPADRCAEKVKVMLDRMKKILAMFKENRAKRHLNYNEEQIHKFEKNKLSELCTQARSMLTDNCLRKRKNLLVTYKHWFGKAAQCQALISVVGASVRQITEDHATLVTKLKNAEVGSSKLINDCVVHLRKDVAASQPPVASQMPAGMVNGNAPHVRLVNGSADVMRGPGSGGSGSGQFSGPSNPTSRQDRLDSLLDGISTSRQSLEELEQLVNENTALIRNFGSLTEEEKNGETA